MANTIVAIRSYCTLLYVFILAPLLAQNITVDTSLQSAHYGDAHLHLKPVDLNKLKYKGLDGSELQTFFYLQVDGENKVLGTYSFRDSSLVFSPRFLPDPDLSHVITFSPAELDNILGSASEYQEVQKIVRFPKQRLSRTRVVGFSPMLDTVPENILRAYLYFSSPMGLDNPFKFINLSDGEGAVVNDAFVEISEGLWNRERTRLTLFFHPGRIKRGVGPHITQGTILQQDQKFRLHVSSEWRDLHGNSLLESFMKDFIAGPAFRERVDPAQWKIIRPLAGSEESLKITTVSILDQSLFPRMVRIRSQDGKDVAGKWHQVNPHVWYFDPDNIWKVGDHTLHMNPDLEDIAGNSIKSLFDVDKKLEQKEELATSRVFTILRE